MNQSEDLTAVIESFIEVNTQSESCDNSGNIPQLSCDNPCNILFACFVCGAKYPTELECQNHWTTEHADGIILCCPLCQLTFVDDSLLDSHLRTQHGTAISTNSTSTNDTQCSTNTISALNFDEKLQVSMCTMPLEYNEQSTLYNGQMFETTGDNVVCIESVSDAIKLETVDVEMSASPTGLTCGLCGKTFRRKKSLTTHIHQHNNVKSVNECSVCGKSFSCRSHLRSHERLHSGVRPYLCPDCGRTFRVADNLFLHLRTHSAARPFVCSYCSASYKRKDKLREHVLFNHETDRLLACSQCDKRFAAPYKLRDHLLTHSGLRPFECDICHKSFHSKIRLDAHRRQIHVECATPASQPPPEQRQCTLCGRVFTCKATLVIHMRRHAGVLPYGCGTCGKHFVSRSELTLHSLKHTNVQPFSCGICGTMFKRKRTMQNHMKMSHDTQRPVQVLTCGYCEKVFRTSGAMYKHRRKFHSEQLTGDQFVNDDLVSDASQNAYNMDEPTDRMSDNEAVSLVIIGPELSDISEVIVDSSFMSAHNSHSNQ